MMSSLNQRLLKAVASRALRLACVLGNSGAAQVDGA